MPSCDMRRHSEGVATLAEDLERYGNSTDPLRLLGGARVFQIRRGSFSSGKVPRACQRSRPSALHQDQSSLLREIISRRMDGEAAARLDQARIPCGHADAQKRRQYCCQCRTLEESSDQLSPNRRSGEDICGGKYRLTRSSLSEWERDSG